MSTQKLFTNIQMQFWDKGEELKKVIAGLVVFPIIFMMIGGNESISKIVSMENVTISPSISVFYMIFTYLIILFYSEAGIFKSILSIFGAALAYGIYLRIEFQDKAFSKLVQGAAFITAFLGIPITIIGISFIIPSTPLQVLPLLLLVYLRSMAFLFLIVGIVLTPAIFVVFLPFEGIFKLKDRKAKATPQMYRNFLLLQGQIPPTPNEPVKHCPFKNQKTDTCTYLNYQTIALPKICDYESTFRRCLVYGRLVQKIKSIKEES